MAKGRKPVPAELAALHGNPRKTKVKPLEPIAGGNLFDAPKWMSAEQREEWRYVRTTRCLAYSPPWTVTNLTAYVVATGLHRRAARELNKARSLFVTVGDKSAKAREPRARDLEQTGAHHAQGGRRNGFHALEPHGRHADLASTSPSARRNYISIRWSARNDVANVSIGS